MICVCRYSTTVIDRLKTLYDTIKHVAGENECDERSSKKPQAICVRCEYLYKPLAIDTACPRLNWEMSSTAQGAYQSAYQIIVADSREALRSSQQVFWKVLLWDEHGKAGRWSQVATFTMGLLDAEDWQGEWIGNHLGITQSCPLLRKEFRVAKKVKRALLYATSCGIHHLTLNGKEVTEDLFAPGWTDYTKRMYYRCYDVTSILRKHGNHCIGVELADGWYREWYGCWGAKAERAGVHLLFKGQIRIEYEDGQIASIASDATWKSTFGPTRRASFYNGEHVDAQLDPRGWNRVGYDDCTWSAAVARKPPASPVLEAYPAEPVRVTKKRSPVTYWKIAPNKIMYDFGQNMAGRVRLHFNGKPGSIIQMRFGEMANLDRTLYIDNMRSALCTDIFVMRGDRNENWAPKFTFHGFRYVEMTGCPVPPSLDNITAEVIGSDTTRVGNFTCSSGLINQIYSNALWTQRANFLEVPTDCPQRDERLGWTGDAQVFIRTAICNMDVAAFFKKWMKDLVDAQYPDGAFPNVAPDVLPGEHKGDAAWGDAGVVCPWTLYECYEDRDLLAQMYPAMQKWISYLGKTSKNYIRDETNCFGDWLSIKADTPKPVIRTAHYAYAANLTSRAAEVLGKKADAKKYAALCSNIRNAFNKAYVSPNGKIAGHTQTAYLMALSFGLLDEKTAKKAARHLITDIKSKDYHLSTGFIGTAMIMSVLRDTGNLDIAYRLLENTTFPSWGYSVVNGATTIWERWNGWTEERGPGDVGMNSYSHYAYGAVVEWMFNTIAGIDHGTCGFQHFRLAPRPGGSLKHAEAAYHSPYGRIRSAWRRTPKSMQYEVSIPANTHATLSLPVADIKTVRLDGKHLHQQEIAINPDQSFILPCGQYKLRWPVDHKTDD